MCVTRSTRKEDVRTGKKSVSGKRVYPLHSSDSLIASHEHAKSTHLM